MMVRRVPAVASVARLTAVMGIVSLRLGEAVDRILPYASDERTTHLGVMPDRVVDSTPRRRLCQTRTPAVIRCP